MKTSSSALKLSINFNNNNFFKKVNLEKESNKNDSNYIPFSIQKHKSFLKEILHLIKLSQNDFLSQISFNLKKNNNNLNKIIKDILFNLKNELISTLRENTESKAKMQNMMNNNKSSLVKSIFDFERENVNNLKKENKVENKLKKVAKIDNKKSYKYDIELPHLKLLNFKIENQLKYMDVVIKLKRESLSDFKHSLIKFEEENVHIFCSNQNDINKASNYLHDDLIKIRNEFKSIVKKKENQNRILELYKSKVIIMKEDVEIMKKKSKNDYINTSDIINEDSREYYTRTNICTIENYLNSKKEYEDINNNFIKKNLIRINKIN